VAIDGAANAAILVAEMVAVTDQAMAKRLDDFRATFAGASGPDRKAP
jgi:phosphoribosylcarboxyaminoimidazole (NCAIR) mutase